MKSSTPSLVAVQCNGHVNLCDQMRLLVMSEIYLSIEGVCVCVCVCVCELIVTHTLGIIFVGP